MLIFVAHVDEHQPARIAPAYMQAIDYDDLCARKSSTLTRRAMRFFRAADLFIFHYPLPYMLFDAIAMVERGVVIVDYHGMTPPHLWDGRDRQFFVEKAQEQQGLLSYADYVIAHSSFTRQEVAFATGLIDPQRIYQMGYVVSLERFHPRPRPELLLKRYGLAGDQPVLLYVGRMATNKRIDDLVRALALVRRRLPSAVLLLVGDDRSLLYAPVVAHARALASELGVADGVIFAGQVPDEELPAHYHLADVFVTASIHEGFCIPVVEAMACGVPVVPRIPLRCPRRSARPGLHSGPKTRPTWLRRCWRHCADITASIVRWLMNPILKYSPPRLQSTLTCENLPLCEHGSS